jgi:pilus assembly protein CpaE
MPQLHEVSLLDRSPQAKFRMGILCVNLEVEGRMNLGALIEQTPGAYIVDNVDVSVAPREVTKLLEPYQYKICLVDLDQRADEGTRTCQRLRDGCEGVAVFAACSDLDPEHIVAALRAGCSEYLAKPFQLDDVTAALTRLEQRRRIRSEGVTKGKLVTVMGAKGGSGVTSLSIHLALNLVQRRQKKVVIVDQHPALGDVSLYLGLPRHRYSFYELVHNTDRLDRDLLEGFILRHDSGLEVLDSPESMDAFEDTSPEAIEHTLAFLADSYDFVIIDCPPGMSEATCAAIRQSEHLAIVITPELPAIRNAARSIEYLTSLHYPEESIDIILNRYSKRGLLSNEEIEAALHRPIAIKLPNDYSQVVNAINSGTPIRFDRRSDLPVAFDAWGMYLAGEGSDAAGARPRSRGLLGLFGS